MGKTKKEQLHPVLKHIESAHIGAEGEEGEENEEQHEVDLAVEYQEPPEVEEGPVGFSDIFYLESDELPSSDYLKSVDLPKLIKGHNNSVSENSNILLTYFANKETYYKILLMSAKNSIKDFTIKIPFLEDKHYEMIREGKEVVAKDLPTTDMVIMNPRIYAVDFGSLTSQKRKEPSQIRIEVAYHRIQIGDAVLTL